MFVYIRGKHLESAEVQQSRRRRIDNRTAFHPHTAKIYVKIAQNTKHFDGQTQGASQDMILMLANNANERR